MKGEWIDVAKEKKKKKKKKDAEDADEYAAVLAAYDKSGGAYALTRLAYNLSDVYSEPLGAQLDDIARTKDEPRAARLLRALALPKIEKRYPKGERMTEAQVANRDRALGRQSD